MTAITGNNKSWTAKINYYLLGCFLFFLPFFQKASVICIAAMLVIWLVSGDVKISIAQFKQDRVIKWFLFFYLVHIAGLLYTSNFSFAFFDLESKLVFLIFPLLLPAYFISKEWFNKLLWVFIFGCLVAALLCLITAFRYYLLDHGIFHFYYTYLSMFLHPTYFSFFLNLSIIILLDELINKWNEFPGIKRAAIIILCYFFFIEIILLSARTANVVAFLSIFIFLLIRFNKDNVRKINYLYGFLFLASLICIPFLILNDINRFADLKTVIVKPSVITAETKIDKMKVQSENSVNLHFKIWEYSFQLASHNLLFGAGTGDVKDELANAYRENNFTTGVSGGLNCHNQFLNTLVTLGLIGLLSLLLIYYFGFKTAVKNKDWIYFSFLLIMFLNSLTESIFEKQNGILFFAAFNMLFYLRNRTANFELPTPNKQ